MLSLRQLKSWFIVGCLVILGVPGTQGLLFAYGPGDPIEYVSVPTEVSLDSHVEVVVSYRSDRVQDILVDFLDNTGYYAGQRITVGASSGELRVTLKIPKTMTHPETAYFAVKAVPVGGQWHEKTDEYYAYTQVILPKEITSPLYYPYPLVSLNIPLRRFLSHHSGYQVEVMPLPELQGKLGVKATDWGPAYAHSIILDLSTGEIRKLSDPTWGTVSSPVRILPPERGGDKALYLTHLREMKRQVEFVGRGSGASDDPERPRVYPELDKVAQYLNAILFQLDPPEKDELVVHRIHELRAGSTYSLSVAYRVPQDRDVWIDLFADGRYRVGTRHAVGAGEGTLKVSFDIPETAGSQNALLSYKIVPRGKSWTDKVFEQNESLIIKSMNTIDDLYVPEKLIAGGLESFEVWYTARTEMDLLIDLFDSQGRWLAGKRFELPQQWNYQSLPFPVPADLASGDNYKVFLKMIPKGKMWFEYIDQWQRNVSIEAGALR